MLYFPPNAPIQEDIHEKDEEDFDTNNKSEEEIDEFDF